MAETYGISRTAAALRVNYDALKKRLQRRTAVTAAGRLETGDSPPFVELAPFASAGPCECLLELENGAGAKMRVHLKSIAVPDLAALSQTFWSRRP
jgi:hypothetical protein